jgi:hypothetical protein
VLDANGTPVRAPDPDRGNGIISGYQNTIKPRQTDSMKVDLANFIHIESEGIYYLAIARRIATRRSEAWKSAFVVSDKIKINVVK